MAILLYCVFACFTLVEGAGFRYQRFTRSVARQAQGSGRVSVDIGSLQSLMSPAWLGALVILSYIVLAVSLVLIFIMASWVSAVVCLVLAFIWTSVVAAALPIPPGALCLRWAENEVSKNMLQSPYAPALSMILMRMDSKELA